MLGVIVADLVELDLDGADVTELPEADKFLDMLHGWPRTAFGLPVRNGNLIGLILPFDLEQLADGLKQPRNIDRLHEIAVMERLRQRRAVRLQRARRNHQNARLMMATQAQRFRHRPS